MSVTIVREIVNAASREAIAAVESTGMNRKALAAALGYKTTDMIRQVLSDESKLFGTVQTIRLARLASAAGSTDLARLVASAEEDLAALCDGDILDQVAQVMAETGASTAAWQEGDWRAARRTALAGIRALRVLLAEIDLAEAAETAAFEAAREQVEAKRPARKLFDYASA